MTAGGDSQARLLGAFRTSAIQTGLMALDMHMCTVLVAICVNNLGSKIRIILESSKKKGQIVLGRACARVIYHNPKLTLTSQTSHT